MKVIGTKDKNNNIDVKNYAGSGKENMTDKKKMVINMNGGQFNYAEGNATIYATQNNGINGKELDDVIKGIMENLSKIKKEDADEIETLLKMVRDELVKPEPKVSRLRNCLTLVAPMFTIANGIPMLMDNLQKLQNIIMQYIK